MRLYHTRLRKEVRVADALTFMAADRSQAEEAFAGDIIGLHNHGTINIGDTFTEGERLAFTGRAELRAGDVPARGAEGSAEDEGAAEGLSQLCEEGATQLFKPLRNNDLILGAVGQLQFEVVAFRLQDEYGVQCVFEASTCTRRAGSRRRARKLEEFRAKAYDDLALDHSGALVYLAPSRVNLQLTLERWPDITFQRDARSTLDVEFAQQTGSSGLVPPSRACSRLGDVRLGQLVVRHDRHGRLLPAILQAVLERRRSRDREHVPAGRCQRHRELRGRARWRRCSAPSRTRAARASACWPAVHGARRSDTTALFFVAKGDWSRPRCSTSALRWGSGAEPVLRLAADRMSRRRASTTSFRVRLRARLSRRRPAVRAQRRDGDEAGAVRSGRCERGGRWSFVMVGIWWSCSRASALLVREPNASPLPAVAAIRAGAASCCITIGHLRGERTMLWFLLAYWFYIDGVNTVIKMAVDYGLSLGLKQTSLITALLLVQFVGFPAALAFGWLGQKIGARAGILIGVAVYAGVCGYAYFLKTERSSSSWRIVIGLVQGGVQSLSRSLFGRLVPEGKAGEFFGFYNMMGKAAAILDLR